MLPARIRMAKTLTARIRWRIATRRVQLTERSWSSVFAKAVSDAVERLDPLELGIHHPELAPHPLDVAVDRAIVHVDVVLIGDIHQLVAVLDHARPGRERFQDQ